MPYSLHSESGIMGAILDLNLLALIAGHYNGRKETRIVV